MAEFELIEKKKYSHNTIIPYPSHYSGANEATVRTTPPVLERSFVLELQQEHIHSVDTSLPTRQGEFDSSTPLLVKNSTGEDKALYFCRQIDKQ